MTKKTRRELLAEQHARCARVALAVVRGATLQDAAHAIGITSRERARQMLLSSLTRANRCGLLDHDLNYRRMQMDELRTRPEVAAAMERLAAGADRDETPAHADPKGAKKAA